MYSLLIVSYNTYVETHRSVDLSTPIDITDDTSLTLVSISDADINDIDNSSVTSESQSIDINSRNLNNNVSDDCDFPSIEVHNTSMLNTTLDNHLDSGNIGTRVRAKNEKVRRTNQPLSVPLAQQSINGTQQSLLRSPAQQSLIETHRSVDLSTPIDITDDTSLTFVSISDADINDIDDNSGNIATRVRAKNEKARKNTVHKKSQHFNTRNLGNRQYVFPESLFIGVSLISSYKY